MALYFWGKSCESWATFIGSCNVLFKLCLVGPMSFCVTDKSLYFLETGFNVAHKLCKIVKVGFQQMICVYIILFF